MAHLNTNRDLTIFYQILKYMLINITPFVILYQNIIIVSLPTKTKGQELAKMLEWVTDKLKSWSNRLLIHYFHPNSRNPNESTRQNWLNRVQTILTKIYLYWKRSNLYWQWSKEIKKLKICHFLKLNLTFSIF